MRSRACCVAPLPGRVVGETGSSVLHIRSLNPAQTPDPVTLPHTPTRYPYGLIKVCRAAALNTEDSWMYEDGQDEVGEWRRKGGREEEGKSGLHFLSYRRRLWWCLCSFTSSFLDVTEWGTPAQLVGSCDKHHFLFFHLSASLLRWCTSGHSFACLMCAPEQRAASVVMGCAVFVL